jgi:tRNA(Arg) A34 adenosine deaminase TadA
MTADRHSRRDVAALVGSGALLGLFPDPVRAQSGRTAYFIAEAFRMRDQAVAAGDQPYGAIIVLSGEIVGYGASRVVADHDNDRHAERVALKDAQRRLGREDVTSAVIYSSSIPCMVCQPVLARFGVARMIHGRQASDAGSPRRNAS